MKDIKNYEAKKYCQKQQYTKIDNGIYEYKQNGEILFVTSLAFVQEQDFGEGGCAKDITPYPLEDILNNFFCHISDFYEELNVADSKICYLEFAAMDIDDIKSLRGIIGKHVYNRDYVENGKTYIKLVIE